MISIPLVSANAVSEAIPEDMAYYNEHNQDEALASYKKLMDYYNKEDDKLKAAWPDEYAGCFIDTSDKFVICVTNDTLDIEKKYESICGKNILFKKVEHNFKTLADAFTCAAAYKSPNVNSVGLSSRKNIVEINVVEQSAISEIETYLKKTMMNTRGSSDRLYEYNIVGKSEYTTTQAVGAGINNKVYVGGLVSRFSIGIYVQRSVGSGGPYLYGFITAGHPFYDINAYNKPFLSNNTDVYLNNSTAVADKIGYVNAADTSIDGMDYALVFLNSGFSPTTLMSDNVSISCLYQGVPSEGTTIYCRGVVGGLSTGHIEYTEAAYEDYVTQYNGFTIDYTSNNGGVKGGDSGGPQYIIENGVRALAGIQSAGVDKQADGKYRYAVAGRADYIFDALGVTIYN